MNLNVNPLVLATDMVKLDLSRNIENKEIIEKFVTINYANEFGSLKELFEHIFQSIENNLKYNVLHFVFFIFFMRNPNDTALRKIIIHNLFSKFCKIKYTNQELFQFVHSLKIFIKSSFCTLLITTPPNISSQLKAILTQGSDLSMKIQEILGRF